MSRLATAASCATHTPAVAKAAVSIHPMILKARRRIMATSPCLEHLAWFRSVNGRPLSYGRFDQENVVSMWLRFSVVRRHRLHPGPPWLGSSRLFFREHTRVGRKKHGCDPTLRKRLVL